MSLIDAALLFSDAQAVTVTTNSTNVEDWAVVRDMAPGEPLAIALRVAQAFTAAGAATLTIALVVADDTTLTTNLTVLEQTPAIPKAALVVGYRLRLGLPRQPQSGLAGAGLGSPIAQRYFGLIFTVATGPMTAGKITAYLDLAGSGDDGLSIFPATQGARA